MPQAAPQRTLILCADDFGLTSAISRTILALIAAGRLTATGAMTNRPAWAEYARELAPLRERADVGVHLNLTCGAPLGAMPRLAPGGTLPPLGVVLKAALVSPDVRAEIAAEIARQLDAFERQAGRAPDFIDGHQHVHAAPVIRRLLIADVAKRYGQGAVWLRDPGDRLAAIRARGVEMSKAMTVAALSRGFRAMASRIGAPLNDSFAGFSAFDPARDFQADFACFLRAPGLRHLVMVHPGGEQDAELSGLDPVVATRPRERDALIGPELPALIAAAGLRLARFAG